jgi:hypothetical protein
MSLKKDFHVAVFHGISDFVTTLEQVSRHPDIKDGINNAPYALKRGRNFAQIAMDDLINAFETVMVDVPEKDIPKEFYTQMLRARDGRHVTVKTSEDRLKKALTEKKKAPHVKKHEMPEFMDVVIGEAPVLYIKTLMDSWAKLVDDFSALAMNDTTLSARETSKKMQEDVADAVNRRITSNQHIREALEKVMNSRPPILSPPSANNNNDEDETSGLAVLDVKDLKPIDQELARLVGLNEPKNQVKKIMARVKHGELRKAAGVPPKEKKEGIEHYVFKGNPGTGKTTFARLVGKIYHDAGLLKKGHVIEADRSSLVAGYIGQTEEKVREIVEKAMDGVLFIDEAYALQGEGKDFGKVAMETLLKQMEINKGRLVVVIAGYPEEIDSLVESNPGLDRRFKYFIDFPDFEMDELMEIFDLNIKSNGLKITPDARKSVEEMILQMKSEKGTNFGNAGMVENIVELMEDELALQLENDGKLSKLDKMVQNGKELTNTSKDELITITVDTVKAVKTQSRAEHQNKDPIGFDFNSKNDNKPDNKSKPPSPPTKKLG